MPIVPILKGLGGIPCNAQTYVGFDGWQYTPFSGAKDLRMLPVRQPVWEGIPLNVIVDVEAIQPCFMGKWSLGWKPQDSHAARIHPPTETHLRLLNRKSLSNGLLSIVWTNDFYDHRQSMLLILFFENKLQVEPVKWLVAEKATVNILCSKLCTFCNVCVVKLHSPSPHLKFQKLNRQTSCQSLSSKKQLPKHIALHGGDYIIISQNLFFIAGLKTNFKVKVKVNSISFYKSSCSATCWLKV